MVLYALVSSLLCFTACDGSENLTIPKSSPSSTPTEIKPIPKPETSASPTPASNTDAEGKLKNKVKGKWVKEGSEEDYDCQRFEINFTEKEEELCVESNQISVKVRYELDAANKKIQVYFTNPGDDLGAGGASLPWEKYDRKKPIAIMDLAGIDKNKISVKWLSFTEVGKTKPVSDAYGKDNEGIYIRKK